MDKTKLVMAVGGAGSCMASWFSQLDGFDILLVNTDKSSLRQFPENEQLLIGSHGSNGFGVLNRAQAKQAFENHRSEIESRLNRVTTLIIVAGLGGNTGSGVASEIAVLAKQRGIKVYAALTLPPAIEGRARREIALVSLGEIERAGAIVIIHDHAEVFADRRNSMRSLEAVLDDAAQTLSNKTAEYLLNQATTR